jgi:ethanolamine utilization microcompartment shell protein EutS
MELPSQSVRSSMLLGFNATGDELIAAEGITAAVTDFMKTLLDDADAAATRITTDTPDFAGIGSPALAALDSTHVAFIDSFNEKLSVYKTQSILLSL